MTFTGLVFSEEVRVRGFALQLFDGFTGRASARRASGREYRSPEATDCQERLGHFRLPEHRRWCVYDLGQGREHDAVLLAGGSPRHAAHARPDLASLPGPVAGGSDQTAGRPGPACCLPGAVVLATLLPTPHYPFPAEATLVRGTVLASGRRCPGRLCSASATRAAPSATSTANLCCSSTTSAGWVKPRRSAPRTRFTPARSKRLSPCNEGSPSRPGLS